MWTVRRGYKNDLRLQSRALKLGVTNDARREIVERLDAYTAWLAKAGGFASAAAKQPQGLVLKEARGDLPDTLSGSRMRKIA